MRPLDQTLVHEDASDSSDNHHLYLTFNLAGEDYSVAVEHVTEIIGIQQVTTVPGMPEELKGVINLRGRVIPVMDVRLKFGLPARDYDERTCVIVIEFSDAIIGLVVDRVNEVIEIDPSMIGLPPMAKLQSYIEGLAKVGDCVKMVLNVEQLVAVDIDPELLAEERLCA